MKALHQLSEERPRLFGCLGMTVGAVIIIPAVGSFVVGLLTNSTMLWRLGSAGIIVWGGLEYFVSRSFMPVWMPASWRQIARAYPIALILIGVVLFAVSWFRS